MKTVSFVDGLSDIGLPNVFNPYTDRCPIYDDLSSPKIRRNNLAAILDASIAFRVDTIWIARDLGYRGGRRTGVPLTDDFHLDAAAAFFGGIDVARSTIGPPVAERTASIIWRVLRALDRPVFLWNIFPFHPHDPDDPMSNRCHTRAERETCKPFLFEVLRLLQPKRVIAIGRDAAAGLSEVGIIADLVRHPSYGGQSEFIDGVEQIYRIKVPLIERRQSQLL
jgi:hypothetical protein